jgi:maltose alpha-D-glucosyltransferase/alpha-amylase
MSDQATNQWYRRAVFYELHVRAFKDSTGDGNGDLGGVIEKLDHLQDLGVDCIWLLPIYQSPLRDGGYDISDFNAIHPDYGSLADFERLVEAAHARGLRVIADLVVNHTSDQHPWFVESRASLDNPKRGWYVWSDTDQRYADARVIFLDSEDSNWTLDPISGQFYWHRFYSHQPDLNYDSPAVRQAMLDVMDFWLAKGIDGFRVDAVPYLIEREGTNCENLPETHAVLKGMRRFVDERWPEALLLCEANQPPAEVKHYFGAGDEFHLAFHFPLMPRLFMALRNGDTGKLRAIMRQTPDIPDSCGWCTFLRNHDELTLEMVSDEEREWMWREYAPDPRMRLNQGIRRRLAPLLDNNVEKIMLAHHVLFSLPGAPVLYYGDEIGMGDDIHLPDRDGVRTPMQWDDSPNAGFSDAPPGALYAPLIDNADYSYRRVNVVAQRADPGSLLNRLKGLIAFRKRYPGLATGSLAILEPENRAIFAVVREAAEGVFVIAHNLSAAPQQTALDLAAYAGGEPVDLLAEGRGWPPIGEEPYSLALAPYESVYLLLRR